MTPSLSGLRAVMLPGVRPSMRLAPEPTATTLSVLLSMATTDGSESTMPCPLTNTSVFAVPRSIAMSRPKSPPNILVPSVRSSAPPPHKRRLEHSVFLHTKVPVAQDHVIQDLYPDYLGRLHEPPRHLPVPAARSDLAPPAAVRADLTSPAPAHARVADAAG